MDFRKDILGVSIGKLNGTFSTIKVGDILPEIDGFQFNFIVDKLAVEYDDRHSGNNLGILFDNGTEFVKTLRPDLLDIWNAEDEEQWNNFKMDNLEISEGILLEQEVVKEKAEKAYAQKERESLIPK